MVLALAPVNFAHKTKQTNKTLIELFPQNLSHQHRLYIYQEPNNKVCPSKDIERNNFERPVDALAEKHLLLTD